MSLSDWLKSARLIEHETRHYAANVDFAGGGIQAADFTRDAHDRALLLVLAETGW